MTVLVLDFDGTMTDAEAEGRPFTDGYLEDLCALVEHLELTDAHFVGFSMGGSMVLNFALKYPRLCRTVAKYREVLGILPSSKRKRFF